jgi:hypothetical protein
MINLETIQDKYTLITKENVSSLRDRDIRDGRVFVEIEDLGEIREVEDLQEARFILDQYMAGMKDESAYLYNNPDPEGDRLAHVVECQLAMDKVMTVIQAIDERIENAKCGRDYRIPYSEFKHMVTTRSKQWELWHRGRETVAKTIGKDKTLWVKFFELKEQGKLEDYLAEYLNKGINKYFTFNGNVVSSDKVDSRHASSEVVYRDSHIQEMKDYDAL